MSPTAIEMNGRAVYQAIFENAATGIAFVRLDGGFLDVNARFCELTGYSKQELLERDFQQITYPPDLEADLARVARLRRGEISSFTLEKRYVRKDGGLVPAELNVSAVLGGDGAPTHFVAVVKDISERVRVQAAAREASRLLDLIFRHSHGCLVLLDRGFNFVRVNETYARACGRAVEDFPGRNHFELYPSEAEASFREVRRTREPWHVSGHPFVFPDHPEWGMTFWNLSLVPLLDGDGQVEFFLFTLDDVTEIKRAEEELERLNATLEHRVAARTEELRRSERQYRTLVETIPHGIQEVDSDGRWTYCSPALERMLGFAPGAMVGRDSAEPLVGEEPRAALRALLAGAPGAQPPWAAHDVVLERRDGERLHATVDWSHKRGVDPAVSGLIGVVTDVTARVRAQAELEEAQRELIQRERLATLGQLTTTVSHELRNPLGIMKTALHVLERAPGTPAAERALARLDRSITRCDRIIGELLDFSRTRPIRRERVALEGWLAEVVADARAPEAVPVTVTLEDPAATATVDAERLRRALVNVLENAYQAVVEAVEAGSDRPPAVAVRAAVSDGSLRIVVEDTGVGVPEADRARVFEPLYSTKSFGVGLGLPVVRQVVEQHGGAVDLGAGAGGGAVVTIELPCGPGATGSA